MSCLPSSEGRGIQGPRLFPLQFQRFSFTLPTTAIRRRKGCPLFASRISAFQLSKFQFYPPGYRHPPSRGLPTLFICLRLCQFPLCVVFQSSLMLSPRSAFQLSEFQFYPPGYRHPPSRGLPPIYLSNFSVSAFRISVLPSWLPSQLRPQHPPQLHRRKPDRRYGIRFLGISPGFFLRLQLHHGLELANRQHGKEINSIRPLQPA